MYKAKLRSWFQILDGRTHVLVTFSHFLPHRQRALNLMKDMKDLNSSKIFSTSWCKRIIPINNPPMQISSLSHGTPVMYPYSNCPVQSNNLDITFGGE